MGSMRRYEERWNDAGQACLSLSAGTRHYTLRRVRDAEGLSPITYGGVRGQAFEGCEALER
jgi:hypothetical protein